MVVALTLPWALDRHVMDLLVLAAIYAIAGLGVSLLLGQCGMLSLAQSLFFGIGAFSTAILSTRFGLHALINIPMGMGLSVLLAVLVGWPILRLHGFFLALATLALGIIGSALMLEQEDWTGGELGISGIPKLQLAGFAFDTPLRFYFLALSLALAVIGLASNLVRGRMGLAMRAMRDAPAAAEVLAIEMHRVKLFMFAFSAVLGALGGSLYAYYLSFINHSSFGVERSIMFLLIPVIAGSQSVWGVLVGALFLTFVPELLSPFGDFHRVMFGLTLVLVVTFLPQGLVGLLRRRQPIKGEA
jgi:branched-chain amino acid transport system permease protein